MEVEFEVGVEVVVEVGVDVDVGFDDDAVEGWTLAEPLPQLARRAVKSRGIDNARIRFMNPQYVSTRASHIRRCSNFGGELGLQ